MRWGTHRYLSIGAVIVIIRTITFLTLGANKSLGCSYKAMRKADGGALRIQHWWRVTRPFFDRNRVNKATFRSLVPFLRLPSTFVPITRTRTSGSGCSSTTHASTRRTDACASLLGPECRAAPPVGRPSPCDPNSDQESRRGKDGLDRVIDRRRWMDWTAITARSCGR
jgi:hypothetical protein